MYVLSFDCSTMLYRAVRAEIFTSLCLYFCFSLVDIFIYSSSLGFLFFSISRLFYSILFSTPFIPVLYLRANKSNGGPFHNAIIFFSSSFRCCCCLRTPCHTINIHWPLLPNTRARNVHTYIVPSRTSPQKRRRQKQFTGLKNRHHKRHTTTTNTEKKKYRQKYVVAPSVRAPSQLLGAPLGSDVQLNCQVEASPAPVSYWLKGGRLPNNNYAGPNVNSEMGQPRPEMLLDG